MFEKDQRRVHRGWRALAVTVGALLVVPLAACASGSGSSAGGDSSGGGDKQVIVYGFAGDWDLWFKDWGTEFKKETGITVKYVSGPDSTMRQRIVAENASRSDVFISTPSDSNQLAEKGLLADIPWDQVPSAKSIDDKFKGAQIGVWGYDLLLPAYNTDKVSAADAPTSWKDLADPKWKDKIALFAPTEEGATRSAMVMEKAYGDKDALDLIQKQYANAKLTFTDAGIAESALATGSVDVSALSLGSAMVATQQAGGAVKTVIPSEGAFVMLNSISMMKNAPDGSAAKKFVAFFLDKWMQNQIMNKLGISVAVDKDVKLDNPALEKALGQPVDKVLATAYFPDWKDWLKKDSSGKTKYDDLIAQITAAAHQ
ncbi:MAG TPA: extracellular solute-binding protein [Pseudolysinimonas sp.]|jgi:ABC-type Fe3+ transport system substrate-binding protein